MIARVGAALAAVLLAAGCNGSPYPPGGSLSYTCPFSPTNGYVCKVCGSTGEPCCEGSCLSAEAVCYGGNCLRPTASPAFVPPAGSFSGPVTVTLAPRSFEAEIRYTLDGTEPTSESALYAAPLSIGSTTTIRATAISPNLAPSEVAAATYVIAP